MRLGSVVALVLAVELEDLRVGEVNDLVEELTAGGAEAPQKLQHFHTQYCQCLVDTVLAWCILNFSVHFPMCDQYTCLPSTVVTA